MLAFVVGFSMVAGTGALATPRHAVQPDTTFGAGTLVVGQDVAPGTYQATGDDSFGCYWARLSDLSGDIDGIIANHNSEAGELATVTIDPSDKGFESSGCGTWAPSGSVGPSSPVSSFGGGTWIVGEDIQAGTYRATVPADSIGCYWARLGDLGGDLDSVLSNGNVEPSARVTVTIDSGDAGFESGRCGTWELAG